MSECTPNTLILFCSHTHTRTHKSNWIENGVFLSLPAFAISSSISVGTFLTANWEPSCRPSCTLRLFFLIIYVICCGQFDLCLHFCMCRKMRVAWRMWGREGHKRISNRRMRGVEDNGNKLHWSVVRFLFNRFFLLLLWMFLGHFFAARSCAQSSVNKTLNRKFRSRIICRVDIDYFFSLCTKQLIRSCYLYFISSISLRFLSTTANGSNKARIGKTKFLNFLLTLLGFSADRKRYIKNRKTSYQAHWAVSKSDRSHAEMRIWASQDDPKIIFPNSFSSSNGVLCPSPVYARFHCPTEIGSTLF